MDEREDLHLTPRQKRRIARGFALFFVVVAVGSTLFVFLMLGEEARRVDALQPLRPGEARRLPVGAKVLLTGTIRADNPHLIRDLVAGCEEHQSTDEAGTWHTKRTYTQPLRVDHGGAVVEVTLRQPCPRGSYRTIPNPDSSLLRWVGYTRGGRLTVVGKVTASDPPAVHADDAYGGDVAAYRAYLSRVRWYVLPFSGFCLLIATVLWLGSRRVPAEVKAGRGSSSAS